MSERVVIVGPGRMGLALGTALRRAGAVESLTYHGRGIEPPPHPIFEDPTEGAAYQRGPNIVSDGTTILLLAVPDRAIGEVAYEYSGTGTAPGGCAALHLSGALSVDSLGPLHHVGYAIGSLHPLQAVADPWHPGDRLTGAAFAVSGEPAAVAAGRRVANALRGRALVIPPALRVTYHAAAVLASNALVTLAAAAARTLAAAGVPEDEALPALLPLMRGTLDNLEHLGIPAALTGPIARGDADTVRMHLARLSEGDRSLYCALGRETLAMARAAGLAPERADELARLLED
ncbi:MAG: Rossmann-like and DUF2520 domain-containing protein [Gemmatimonadota bacterium]